MGRCSRALVCSWCLAPAAPPSPPHFAPQTVLLAHLALISLFLRHLLHAFATLQFLRTLWDHFAKEMKDIKTSIYPGIRCYSLAKKLQINFTI